MECARAQVGRHKPGSGNSERGTLSFGHRASCLQLQNARSGLGQREKVGVGTAGRPAHSPQHYKPHVWLQGLVLHKATQ